MTDNINTPGPGVHWGEFLDTDARRRLEAANRVHAERQSAQTRLGGRGRYARLCAKVWRG